MPIVLGSASPRRRDLFDALGIQYELSPADIDERAISYKTPRELAIKVAYAKALEVEKRYTSGLIIAVDTIVVYQGRVFGKPDDVQDAEQMLAELTGNAHTVISGLAVKEVGKTTLLDAEQTYVHLRALTPEQIEQYVATGEPLDKAGSYAIQGIGRDFVDRIEGDYFNVVGLPVKRLLDMMEFFVETSAYRCRLKTLNVP
jgi:septum formation protein